MRSCPHIFWNMPLLLDLRRCEAFNPIAAVDLADASLFGSAVGWCKAMWRHQSRQFRVVPGSRRTGPGTFEFADTTHAVEFWLRFG